MHTPPSATTKAEGGIASYHPAKPNSVISVQKCPLEIVNYTVIDKVKLCGIYYG